MLPNATSGFLRVGMSVDLSSDPAQALLLKPHAGPAIAGIARIEENNAGMVERFLNCSERAGTRIGPVYSDKHGIFRVNSKEAAGGGGVTQFGRALLALNIDIICANSPQAKGRIERAFGTLQDRMVKELRLAGVSAMDAANAWLPGFITAYNARFGRDPANAKDLHRPLAPADNLDEIRPMHRCDRRHQRETLPLHPKQHDRRTRRLRLAPAARSGATEPHVTACAYGRSRMDRPDLRAIGRADERHECRRTHRADHGGNGPATACVCLSLGASR